MKRTMFATLAGVLSLTLLATAATPAGAADPAAASARSWIASQQQADGGFEVAGFPGFETPDAVLALAEGGQSGSGWSTAEAVASVRSIKAGDRDALDALDDFADAGINAAQAAKLVVLVVAPLGLNASDFDPSADSPSPVDLQSLIVSQQGDGSYPSLGAAFNGRLYVVMALRLMGVAVPDALVATIRAAQQANGSWNYLGDPAGSDLDADSTGTAIQALIAAGVSSSDEDVVAGLRSLAESQRPSGAWAAFGSDDPNSTAVAMLGIVAAGGSLSSPCWRNKFAPSKATAPYASPEVWLRAQQDGSGRVVSPNDLYGINTFATSQSAHSLSRAWLPVAVGAAITCDGAATPTAITGTPDQKFVRTAYLDVLGRAADAGGLGFHTARLAAGARPSSVPRALTGSREYRNQVVAGLYRDYLDVVATAEQKAAAEPLIKAGRRLEVQVGILSSAEYYSTAGSSNAAFVEALYRDLTGALPTPADRDALVAALGAGTTRAEAARSVATSEAARTFTAKSLYLKYLRRAGDTGGVAFWAGKLGSGTSMETIVIHFVGSSEYGKRARA